MPNLEKQKLKPDSNPASSAEVSNIPPFFAIEWAYIFEMARRFDSTCGSYRQAIDNSFPSGVICGNRQTICAPMMRKGRSGMMVCHRTEYSNPQKRKEYNTFIPFESLHGPIEVRLGLA